MTEAGTTRKAEGIENTRGIMMPLAAEYLLSCMGLFTTLPVLPLLVRHFAPGSGAILIGIDLFLFNFLTRGGSLLCGWLLNRLPARLAMSGGLGLAACGFALLTEPVGYLGLDACLGLAGLGIGIHALMSRAYVATAVSQPQVRNVLFSTIQVAGNVSAAAGPVIAYLLVGSNRDTWLVLIIAATYALAAVVVLAFLPPVPKPGRQARRTAVLRVLLTALTDREVRRVTVVTVTGNFLYGQLFSAFVINADHVTSSALGRAGFFIVNAVLVVVVQIPVAWYFGRGLSRGVPPLAYLLAGLATFAAACFVFGLAGSAITGLVAGIAVFSLAETFFTPTTSTAYAALGGNRTVVETFNLQQAAIATGESLGAFTGGALFSIALARGFVSLYWIIVGAAALAAVAPYARNIIREASRHDH